MTDIAKPLTFRRHNRKSFVESYGFWILLGLILAVLLLIVVLFDSTYKLNSAIEVLWNNTFSGGLTRCQ
jgi:hypothetical protein